MADEDIQVMGATEEDLRKQAITSLKKKQNFRNSLIAQAYDAYGRRHVVSEADISEEMSRLRGG